MDNSPGAAMDPEITEVWSFLGREQGRFSVELGCGDWLRRWKENSPTRAVRTAVVLSTTQFETGLQATFSRRIRYSQ